MAITALFSPASATLVEFGDDLDNTIVTSRDAAGNLLVNGGAVAIKGPKATVANTSLIQVYGGAGNDVITLDESNGALPRAHLFGGAGNDSMTGGSGNDQLFGQSGNDWLFGKGGNDSLFGGTGNDVLTGGDGNDQIYGEAGDDRMVWNPGDDSDLMEGGDGTDTVEVNGGNGAEVFTITANGTRVRFDRIDPAPFTLDIGTTEQLVLNANGGDDVISAVGNLSALIRLTIDGGAGNDRIFAGNGADLLLGGDGNDFVDGQQGNDVAFLGAGDDVFQWDPGDGSDIVEGQAGNDTLAFNGSNAGEIVDLSADGGRTRLARNVGSIVMDLDDVERIEVNALGGADTVTINPLNGTDVAEVVIRLAGTLGGSSGDAAADTVIARGSQTAELIDVFGSAGELAVVGLGALVRVSGSEGANDALVVAGGAGDDRLSASTLAAGVTQLTLDGGSGHDVMIGSQGADVLLGGDGNDFVDGQQGNDTAFLGAGDDLFQWDPGDGSDVVEGQDGHDTLRFNGSGASENVTVAANGGRAIFFRDVANVTMDLNDVERIEFRALGGADAIAIGDLTGTDVTQVAIDLAGATVGGDGQSDQVLVNATQGNDTVSVVSSGGLIAVGGLAAQTTLANAEAGDRLVLNGLGGDDVIDASGLGAGTIGLQMQGGLGADLLIGSAGSDLVRGGDGNDVALMGAGDDAFVWNPGDDNDIVEGQDGFDTLQFNGANVAENITVSSNGGRARFFRDVASVTMDLNDVERIDHRALGGADTIVVDDLAGTDVTEVHIDLGAATGGGDAQADTVLVNGSAGDDVILVTMDGTTLYVHGLAAQVVISNFEGSLDRLVINGLAGDDVVEASTLLASVGITAYGGDGDDVLIGGAGNDTLIGGAGDDVVLGGGGTDWLEGEIAIQSFAGLASGDILL